MGKIVLNNKKGKISITNTLIYPETVNERVYNAISSDMYEGFIPIVMRKKRNEVSIECVVQGYITLEEYFGDIVTKHMFLSFVHQILMQIRYCEKNIMNSNCLDLRRDRIFIDPHSKMVKCIYWPVVNNQQANPVDVFLKNLPYDIFFNPNENCDYLETYKAFFDGIKPFSINNFEKMLLELQGKKVTNNLSVPSEMKSSDLSRESEIRRYHEIKKANIEYDPFAEIEYGGWNHTRGNKINREKNFCESCGSKITYKANFCSNCGAKVENKGVIDDDEEIWDGGTTNLGYSRAVDKMIPILMRKKTAEKFGVDKETYRIGKRSTVCDLCISDNKYVSKTHADIITRGNRYYIVDKTSKNHTYINGNIISPEVEVEIFSGARIRLGNEEFLFSVEGFSEERMREIQFSNKGLYP